jgi:hypothetical protein
VHSAKVAALRNEVAQRALNDAFWMQVDVDDRSHSHSHSHTRTDPVASVAEREPWLLSALRNESKFVAVPDSSDVLHVDDGSGQVVPLMRRVDLSQVLSSDTWRSLSDAQRRDLAALLPRAVDADDAVCALFDRRATGRFGRDDVARVQDVLSHRSAQLDPLVVQLARAEAERGARIYDALQLRVQRRAVRDALRWRSSRAPLDDADRELLAVLEHVVAGDEAAGADVERLEPPLLPACADRLLEEPLFSERANAIFAAAVAAVAAVPQSPPHQWTAEQALADATRASRPLAAIGDDAANAILFPQPSNPVALVGAAAASAKRRREKLAENVDSQAPVNAATSDAAAAATAEAAEADTKPEPKPEPKKRKSKQVEAAVKVEDAADDEEPKAAATAEPAVAEAAAVAAAVAAEPKKRKNKATRAPYAETVVFPTLLVVRDVFFMDIAAPLTASALAPQLAAHELLQNEKPFAMTWELFAELALQVMGGPVQADSSKKRGKKGAADADDADDDDDDAFKYVQTGGWIEARDGGAWHWIAAVPDVADRKGQAVLTYGLQTAGQILAFVASRRAIADQIGAGENHVARIAANSALADGRVVRTSLSLPPLHPLGVAQIQREEFVRYAISPAPFSYSNDGHWVLSASTGPAIDSNKARHHILLRGDRPSHITLMTVVADAMARMPGGVATRADVAVQVSASPFFDRGTHTDADLIPMLSGALDRLRLTPDPCVRFSATQALWIYMWRSRPTAFSTTFSTASPDQAAAALALQARVLNAIALARANAVAALAVAPEQQQQQDDNNNNEDDNNED